MILALVHAYGLVQHELLSAKTTMRSPASTRRSHVVPQPKLLAVEVMAMTILSEFVLVESKSARDNHLISVSSERATEILNKIKTLYFTLWNGFGASTTGQMVSFYEVNIDAVESVLRRHRDEFESDGLKTLKGRQLKVFKDASASLTETSKTSQLVIWTPRAALRLGMVLRDSIVAQALRTSLLDAVEKVIPAQAEEIERLKLELELAKTQERLMQTTNAIATLHGSGMVALILGKPDAVVERVTEIEKTILCNERGQPMKTYQGLSKTKLAKRYGMKKAADVVTWLESIGKADLLQSALTTAPCQYVPFESVAELDRDWALGQGSRQRLLGE